jgi:uncharacterized membrane protein
MTRTHAVGSLLRFAGFLLLIAAVIPAVRGDGINVTRMVIAIALFMTGIIVGLKARQTK